MAKAGRLMARRKKARGHSPAASRACLVGRSITRPRLYRRSHRAGCEAFARADKMTAESTARPLLNRRANGWRGGEPPYTARYIGDGGAAFLHLNYGDAF